MESRPISWETFFEQIETSDGKNVTFWAGVKGSEGMLCGVFLWFPTLQCVWEVVFWRVRLRWTSAFGVFFVGFRKCWYPMAIFVLSLGFQSRFFHGSSPETLQGKNVLETPRRTSNFPRHDEWFPQKWRPKLSCGFKYFQIFFIFNPNLWEIRSN